MWTYSWCCGLGELDVAAEEVGYGDGFGWQAVLFGGFDLQDAVPGEVEAGEDTLDGGPGVERQDGKAVADGVGHPLGKFQLDMALLGNPRLAQQFDVADNGFDKAFASTVRGLVGDLQATGV